MIGVLLYFALLIVVIGWVVRLAIREFKKIDRELDDE